MLLLLIKTLGPGFIANLRVGHLTAFRNDRFGDGQALHFDEPSLSVSVVARRPDLLDQARSQERLMESFAFRRFRLRPKTRANRSF